MKKIIRLSLLLLSAVTSVAFGHTCPSIENVRQMVVSNQVTIRHDGVNYFRSALTAVPGIVSLQEAGVLKFDEATLTRMFDGSPYVIRCEYKGAIKGITLDTTLTAYVKAVEPGSSAWQRWGPVSCACPSRDANHCEMIVSN